MAWRLAKSLDTLRDQINTAYPIRNKGSDGTIGDTKHQATKSEHNPNTAGVVRAMDITNDPAHGVNAREIAEGLVASRDSRILYVISNAQICSSVVSPWKWRTYRGSNPHKEHFHISVVGEPKLYDNTKPWSFDKTTAPVKPPITPNKKLPTSIRTNNPGAINAAAWVQAMRGYKGFDQSTPGNRTAIFETPEQGVAVFWELLNRYRRANAYTIENIIRRYGGGQDYSEYVDFVAKRTGLGKDYEIKLHGDDDANLLKFAKAMFRYEAGRETPLTDEQILNGFKLARGDIVETESAPESDGGDTAGLGKGFFASLSSFFKKDK